MASSYPSIARGHMEDWLESFIAEQTDDGRCHLPKFQTASHYRDTSSKTTGSSADRGPTSGTNLPGLIVHQYAHLLVTSHMVHGPIGPSREDCKQIHRPSPYPPPGDAPCCRSESARNRTPGSIRDNLSHAQVDPSGPVVIILASGSEVRRFNPGRGRWIFSEH